MRAGWLVESSTPITQEQFAELRETAAAAGVTVEVRHDQANLATLRTVATTVGLLVALGVMAMTVGLIRSEATGDLRVLSAAGATSSNRRTLTAATAGAWHCSAHCSASPARTSPSGPRTSGISPR